MAPDRENGKLYVMTRPSVAVFPSSQRAGSALSDQAYLTDGRRLFRVVSTIDPRLPYPVAELEDCRTLAIESYSAPELYAMTLRPVVPADIPA
jgi:hypothetical protein